MRSSEMTSRNAFLFRITIPSVLFQAPSGDVGTAPAGPSGRRGAAPLVRRCSRPAFTMSSIAASGKRRGGPIEADKPCKNHAKGDLQWN